MNQTPASFAASEDEDDGERLDKVLAARFPELSRTRLQSWIREGGVQVEGRPSRSSHRLTAGQIVSMHQLPAPPSDTQLTPQQVEFRVVYEDDHVAVIDKPDGLAVHPGAGQPDGTLANGILHRWSGINLPGALGRPGIVHRLDRDTTGLMVVALSEVALRGLAAQLQDRSLTRIYHGLCWGVPEEERIEAPLGRDPSHRTRMAVVADGRPAATRVTLLRAGRPCSLIACQLESGRTHQIRVHLTHRRHPLVGDDLYGGGASRARALPPLEQAVGRASLRAIARQALHATTLGFVHPVTGAPLMFESPWPTDFQEAVRAAFGETAP